MSNLQENCETVRRRGGPATTKGKSASRRNALTHGLSARTLLPEVLNRDLITNLYRQLSEEWQPTTPTQNFFVLEMARHQAALERIQQIEDAALRRGARGALHLLFEPESEHEQLDAALAAAGTSEAIDRITRYRRPHERAFLKNLSALRDAKALSSPREEPSHSTQASSRPARLRQVFTSEAECEAHLLARQAGSNYRCPNCGACDARWIASRKTWQCCSCKRQASLRAGTVMYGSRLSLLSWFRAIELLVNKPQAPIAELTFATGIRRTGTVRRIARHIRQALKTPQGSAQLAGLDRLFLSTAMVPG